MSGDPVYVKNYHFITIIPHLFMTLELLSINHIILVSEQLSFLQIKDFLNLVLQSNLFLNISFTLYLIHI